ncbi:MAG: PQQ-binding-like beta-propeller repeat protein [Planctomycetota bacterium]
MDGSHPRGFFLIRSGLFLLLVVPATGLAEDWPQWRGINRDGKWTESSVIKEFGSTKLTPQWSVPIGSGYSGPTVADGRVFVMDRKRNPDVERVICIDESTGKKLWTHKYDCEYTINYEAGPRASVTVDGNRAYGLGAMGNVCCLNTTNGEVFWELDLKQHYKIKMPIWGLAGSPLIYNDIVVLHISGKQGACVVGLDKSNGEERWRALDDRGQYSSPIIVKQAGQDVVVVWTGDSVSGLDPLSGKVHWRYPFLPKNMPIGIATPIVEKDKLFVTSFYDGSLMLKLLDDEVDVELLWEDCGQSEKRTVALHSIISTPLFKNGYLFGCDSYGELRCLDPETGKRIWEDKTATPRDRWSNLHFVENGNDVWMFNEKGELIISELSKDGFKEKSRAKLIEPTTEQLRRGVCWSHPAFANRHVIIRNDKEIIRVSLEAR